MIHEGAWAVIDRLTGDGHVVGVHHAMDEAHMHPARNERRLFVAHALEQSEVGVRVALQLRIMAIDCVIGQAMHFGLLTAGGEKLEGAHTDVAGSNARQNRARQRSLAKDGLACEDRRKRPRRRDTKRVHRFADQIFTQHRPECRPAVAGARKGSGTRAFELNVATTSVAVDHLAEEQRPPVAKLGHEAPELVAGVRLGQRRRSLGYLIARKDPRAFLGIESTGIQPQFFSQLTVELDQPRPRDWRRFPGHVGALEFARIRIVENEARGGRVVSDVRHRVTSLVR